MGRTNLPDDFDFLDPTSTSPACPWTSWPSCASPSRSTGSSVPDGCGGFEDNGYWLVTKHADVKEVSRRSDVFSSWQNGAIPTWPKEMTREEIELQRSVMLNMDAPHHTRLRKIISRGFTPRAIGRLQEDSPARAEHRQDRGRRGRRRLRRAGVVRAAAAGHRRPARRAAGGPRQAVPLVQRDDRRRRIPSTPTSIRRSRRWTDHVRDGDGRGAGQEPDRRHRHAS